MSADDKNREILSRLVADLFIKTKGGEELPSKINRLRDEIKKVIEDEDTIFGKFRRLVESLREIIPDEQKRYNAAVKALSTTSKLSQQEIVKAVGNQLEELKILEKGLLPALPGWRDELKIMEAKSRELRDEVSKLRERVVQLEIEEKVILNDLSGREKQMELVEKAVKDLFAEIGAEVANTGKKVEEFTSEPAAQPALQKDSAKSDLFGQKVESAAARPVLPGDSMKSGILDEEKGDGGQKSEIFESPAQQDTGSGKKCPMCGGRMNFHADGEMWICYSCAHEEPG
ncbi:MAG TPA: hypothetical protein VF903_09745, partial [Nitrospirota bacterium]